MSSGNYYGWDLNEKQFNWFSSLMAIKGENTGLTWNFLRNVIIKSVILFMVINIIFAFVDPLSILGKVSAYNLLFPGRLRFPFGENQDKAYNLSLENLDAMNASHIIAGTKKSTDEFRVIIIGDSSVWGTLLRNEETLTGQINKIDISYCGAQVKAFNLGYPTLSLLKDLEFISKGLTSKPDLLIWMVTLNAFPREIQLISPIVANNPERVSKLLNEYNLDYDEYSFQSKGLSFWEKTIIGQRRNLADLARLQLYGVLWGATGVDQEYPEEYSQAKRNFSEDYSYRDRLKGQLSESDLSFDILHAGILSAGEVPVLIVNEPILVATGLNSDIRYNFFYPRWAYDQYRAMMDDHMTNSGVEYLDLWNFVPENEFTNSAIHLSAMGTKLVTDRIIQEIVSNECQ
jgi:hypothetical protein